MSKQPQLPDDEKIRSAAAMMTTEFLKHLARNTGEFIQIPEDQIQTMFHNYIKKAIPLGWKMKQKMETSVTKAEQKQLLFELLDEISEIIISTFYEGKSEFRKYIRKSRKLSDRFFFNRIS